MFRFGDKKLPIESYKGVRDFFPEDQARLNYIFKIMRQVCESFGFEEYGASILESSELYKSKTSEEIVNEQTYTFIDRGGREVTLRPEMTPTVARMISARYRDYPAPIRWYSIQNVFRYEKPQRGRLREHWQLNADIFGGSDMYADIEVIKLASAIMSKFGAKSEDFEIRINSRAFLSNFFDTIQLSEEKKMTLFRLLDRKDKMSDEDFRNMLKDNMGEEVSKKIVEMLYFGEAALTTMGQNDQPSSHLNGVIDGLRKLGIQNVKFSPTLTRGFDYYTGIVFEVFDTNKENTRSLFGGGRYDKLTENFIEEQISGVGFGMGDVTIQDFLESHGLSPNLEKKTKLWLAVAPDTDLLRIYELADKIRGMGINVAIDISDKKLSDQLKSLEKRGIPYLLVVGNNELDSDSFVLRNTINREEKTIPLSEIATNIK